MEKGLARVTSEQGHGDRCVFKFKILGMARGFKWGVDWVSNGSQMGNKWASNGSQMGIKWAWADASRRAREESRVQEGGV